MCGIFAFFWCMLHSPTDPQGLLKDLSETHPKGLHRSP